VGLEFRNKVWQNSNHLYAWFYFGCVLAGGKTLSKMTHRITTLSIIVLIETLSITTIDTESIFKSLC